MPKQNSAPNNEEGVKERFDNKEEKVRNDFSAIS
jgi:hypothetical protein